MAVRGCHCGNVLLEEVWGSQGPGPRLGRHQADRGPWAGASAAPRSPPVSPGYLLTPTPEPPPSLPVPSDTLLLGIPTALGEQVTSHKEEHPLDCFLPGPSPAHELLRHAGSAAPTTGQTHRQPHTDWGVWVS